MESNTNSTGPPFTGDPSGGYIYLDNTTLHNSLGGRDNDVIPVNQIGRPIYEWSASAGTPSRPINGVIYGIFVPGRNPSTYKFGWSGCLRKKNGGQIRVEWYDDNYTLVIWGLGDYQALIDQPMILTACKG